VHQASTIRQTTLLVLLLAYPVGHATAQSAGHARAGALTIDNDLVSVRGAGPPPDYDYTHGAKLALSWAGAPRFVRHVFGRASNCRSPEGRRAGCISTAVAAGQEIYTPRNDASQPIPGERPYAGWLYATATVRRAEPGLVRTLGVEVGVSGPPSLAEPVQNSTHRLLGNEPQLGWAHQLPTSFGVTARYDEGRRAERALGQSAAAAVALRWGAAAGTVITAFSAGADVTLGLRGNLPWSPAEPEVEQPTRLYARAGVRQDVVLRNVFVEGRPGSGRAEQRPFVVQADVGVGYRRRTLGLEYRHVVRTREYAAQPSAHAYGSITLTIHGY
jgi:lipid A 3-O-deacylase